MRVVVALGGNALLKRGEPMTAENQRANVRAAAPALAAVARQHQLVLSHGNGPQVGLLALQAAAYTDVEPYPLDVLGAQTEGMIGYVLEQELGNVMPPDAPLATILTMVEVDPADPAFDDPTKFVGPIYTQDRGGRAGRRRRAGRSSRTATAGAGSCRRPSRGTSSRSGRSAGCSSTASCVICAGGGGVPTMFLPGAENTLVGVEAVIDKDLASELLAREVDADLFVMATDVDAVYADWGTPEQRALGRVTRRRAARERRSRPARWGRRSRRPAASSRPPGGAPPSARSTQIQQIVDGDGGHPGGARDRRTSGTEET